ncbi:MAG: aminopeptidase P family protein [Chloroflexi bacterium]|nr:aminopeptidase P family protein [Chloroflexota bacterium]
MTSTGEGLYVGVQEHLARLDAARRMLQDQELDALCLFGTWWIFYFTGFAYQPSERPVCVVVPVEGEAAILVPDLEREHIEGMRATLPRATTYPEYPGLRRPMSHLEEMMQGLGLSAARLGCDSDGYGGMWGSRGPSLSAALPQAKVANVRAALEAMRMVKSAAELRAIREAARFGNLAHRLLQDYTRPGLTEIEIGHRASLDASIIVMKAFGPGYSLQTFGGLPAHAGFKAGPDTALPHPLPGARSLQPGDVLVSWAEVKLDGYHAELERTMILGQPTAEQRRFFDLACQIQEVGLAAVRPGGRCADVDRQVRRFAEEQGLTPHLRHHAGHAFGLETHEPPYLDLGDQTELVPGMVFSMEPGLYVPGVGGFRHSDTVLVTDHGCELLTYYPRDLASLTIPL